MRTYIHTLITEEIHLPFYLKIIGGGAQAPTRRVNGFTDHQWIHCVNGKGKLIIDNKEFIISKNTGFYLSPSIPHEYFPTEEPWVTHFIAFAGYDTLNLLSFLGLNQYAVFSFHDIKFLHGLLTDMFYTALTGSLTSGFRCSGKLYHFLMELKNTIRENNQNLDHSTFKKIQAVLSFMEENYNKNPTINEMAALIEVSPQYLCRIFKQALCIRPFAYLTKYRLQKSKEILIYDVKAKVEDIAKTVGYQDTSYFCAMFKKYEGMSPSEFRYMHKVH